MSSEVQGGCVLVALVCGAFAGLYVISDAAAVLVSWLIGVVLLWRAVDKPMSDSSTTPPPVGVAPSEDVYADESVAVDRVERGPEGVMFTVHPKRSEVRRKD